MYRPTPEEIIEPWMGEPTHFGAAGQVVSDLAFHGYRIVHPADVYTKEIIDDLNEDYAGGWNACRRLIFGDDSE